MTDDLERARENGLRAAKTVEKSLTDVGWAPERTSEYTDQEAVLRVDFSGDNIPIADAVAKVRIERERFVFRLNFRDGAPAPARDQVVEFITRVNFGLIIGAFEMDFDGGAVRFRSSVDFTQVELSELLVRNAILSAMDVVEYYGEALVDVMFGRKVAQEAIDEARARVHAAQDRS